MTRENYRGIPVPLWGQDPDITVDRAFKMGVDKALEEIYEASVRRLEENGYSFDVARVFEDHEGDRWFEVAPNQFVVGFNWSSAEKYYHAGVEWHTLTALRSQYDLTPVESVEE